MTIAQAKSELMQIYGALSPNKQRAIDTLVKIEPKIGYWDSRTCKCSECGYQITFSEYAERKYKYCPSCGARMESEVNGN